MDTEAVELLRGARRRRTGLTLFRCPSHRYIPHPFPHKLLAAWLWRIGCLVLRLNGAPYGRFSHCGNGSLGPAICAPCFGLERFRFRQIRPVVLH